MVQQDINSNFNELSRRGNQTDFALAVVAGLVGLLSLLSFFDTIDMERHAQSIDSHPKHDHAMQHYHTDETSYGRVRTGAPGYLSGISGWY